MSAGSPTYPAREHAFDPGLDVRFRRDTLDFEYGHGVFGPSPEHRSLDSIRQSLRDPNSPGPDPVYAIAMDVGRIEDREEMQRRMLLFGIVMYAHGRLGDGPVRSQGHVHAIAPHCGWSTPELFEIWEGRAIVYGQENSGDDPGRCIAVEASPGERVVMPPGWAHFVANANAHRGLIFGAWCDRQYGFEYGPMRAHHGLAWHPLISETGEISWKPNPSYAWSMLQVRKARDYPELSLSLDAPLYDLLRSDPESIQWISEPGRLSEIWKRFEP
ncbi:MAG TPA: glucose-6-phosphate isomerase family protein [Candidatus Acidoferrales bacterium]|nr:glucose-6-phosphate isomerase family protein [Candidatus Acidoferrales bacterium]